MFSKAWLRDRAIDVTPPDVSPGRGLLDDELVPGGTAGVETGPHHGRAEMGDVALDLLDHVLVQLRRVVGPVPPSGR